MTADATSEDQLLLHDSAVAGQQRFSKPPGKVLIFAGLTALACGAGAILMVVHRPVRPVVSASAAEQPQGFFLRSVDEARICKDFTGVKFAEKSEAVPLWEPCVKKWSEDCSGSGCCRDAGMRCFEKNERWAACKATCDKVDEANETWTCNVIEPEVPRNSQACREGCRLERSCVQATFDSTDGGSCSLLTKQSSTIAWASDNFNSTFCGSDADEDLLRSTADEVSEQLPFVQPTKPVQQCSWGGEDCSVTKCCNNVDCDEKFISCNPYSCYKQDDYFSGCLLHDPSVETPAGGKAWDGKWLGGGRERLAIAPAGSQAAVHGTSLYCFSVINWHAPAPKAFWDTEAQLANNMKTHGVGIFQCDGHDFYDGEYTPKAKWGSFSNIDAFQKVWAKVQEKGDYKKYDWIVKVDADAVFFPDRLKMHLDKLRTPLDARVYLENVDYQFKFMGALEVLTREALDLYLDKSHTCIRGKHEGGEDFFMKGCMDAIGVDYQSDYELLNDKYAMEDGPCTDGWAVAYHFHKKILSWNWCYNEAVCGARGTCQNGIGVPFVMPWTPNPTTKAPR